MSLRRAGTLTLAFALAACTTVSQSDQPADLVFATFNSTTGAIPIPNDLVLQNVAAVTPLAQQEVLKGFIKSGGFPSDQEVAITIPFNRITWEPPSTTYPNGRYKAAAPPAIDTSTVTPSTVALLKVDGATATPVTYQATYNATTGILTLRKPVGADGSRHWAGGRYVVAVRGGASGVKQVGGGLVSPDTGIELAIQDVDLTNPANQPPGMTPALAAQAEGLRQALRNPFTWSANAAGAWTPAPSGSVLSAFAATEAIFPRREAAVIATFGIDRSAHVALDPTAGQVPFPSDFMLEHVAANCPTGVAPCLSATASAAFGASGAPLRTLDGFSTSALLLAPLTGAVDATTITAANVHLFDLSTVPPTLLKDLASTAPTFAGAKYVTQPPGTSSGGFATTLVLAPAVPAQVSASVTLAMPPLKEKTTYAVVVTKRVKNADGTAMTRGTVGNIVLGTTAPLYGTVGGNNLAFVQGLDYPTAVGLQTMRDSLAGFFTALPLLTAGATTKDDVAMVYTVTTQSVTGTSVKLSAAPLSIEQGAATAIFTPSAADAFTPPAGVPTAGVNGFYTVTFNGVDGIDKATGAFRPTLATDLAGAGVLTLLTPLKALVAIPEAASVPLCPSPPFPAGARCAKVVIFGHGLNGNRYTMLATAASLASAGFIAAAIDFPLHGDRNWCSADSDCTTDGTTGNGTCDKSGAFAGSATQGDAVRPGVCANGSTPLLGAFPSSVGSRYFVGGNFFRIRDAFRQNQLDQATLALALARPPAPYPQPPGNPLTAHLPAGVIIDPSEVYYEGISLGSIAGTSVLATNPRVTRAALSVGGASFVDIASTSPTFMPLLDQVLAGLLPGYSRAAITPGNAAFDAAIYAKYVQLLQVAKWVLDPGDPINYAGHVTAATLPNLLANPDGSVPQTAKAVFAQIALGDTVVPNPTNLELDLLLNGHTTIYSDDNPAGGPAPHSMLATIPAVQADAAAFLVDIGVFPAATKQVTIP